MVCTFAVLSLLRTDLQQLSIAALIIGLGMIVDDAVVVTDNIRRYIQLGHAPKEAAVKATAEVAVPVFTSTLTTVFGFAPAARNGRRQRHVRARHPDRGQRFAARKLRDGGDRLAARRQPRIQRPGRKAARSATAAAGAVAAGALPARAALDAAAPCVQPGCCRWSPLAASLALFPILGVQFFPGAERDQFVIDIYAPKGTAIEETAQHRRQRRAAAK